MGEQEEVSERQSCFVLPENQLCSLRALLFLQSREPGRDLGLDPSP